MKQKTEGMSWNKILFFGLFVLIFISLIAFVGVPQYAKAQEKKESAMSELTGKIVQGNDGTGSNWWEGQQCTVDSSYAEQLKSDADWRLRFPTDQVETGYDSYCIRLLKYHEGRINDMKSKYVSDEEILATSTESMTSSEKTEYIKGFKEGMYVFSSNLCSDVQMCGNRNGAFTQGVFTVKDWLLHISSPYPLSEYPSSTFEDKGWSKAKELCYNTVKSAGVLLW